MPLLKTNAVVLGYHPLGDADKIIIFCTEDFGEVRAVARGVRKVRNRLCGRLEVLTFGNLIFFERANKDLHIVDSFDIVESFQVLREDLLKMAYCSHMSELVRQTGAIGLPDAGTFDLVLATMFMMKTADDPEMLARTFEIRLLANAGLRPQLDHCVACSGDIGTMPSLGFSVTKGGVLCVKCRRSNSAISISRGTVELMKRMQQITLELLPRLGMTETSRRELREVLTSFISFHMDGRRLRSLDFLASIERDLSATTVGTGSGAR